MTQTTRPVRVTPTISSGSAYAAGDALGGKQSITGLTQAGFGGVIVNIGIVDLDAQNAEIQIHFFDDDITPTADNAAFDPADADLTGKWLGSVTIASSDYTSHADNSTATKACTFPFRAPQGTVYAQARIAAAKTYASTSSLTFVYSAIPD